MTREARVAYAKAHYEANKDTYVARAIRFKQDRRVELRALAASSKQVPCMDCGVEYPPWVMQYDHVRGKKVGNIADLVGAAIPIRQFLDEIAKCEVVCANCHAERTYRRAEASRESA